MSPGWQSSASQMAFRAEKRTARALPVLRIDRLVSVMSTFSASSLSVIGRACSMSSDHRRRGRPPAWWPCSRAGFNGGRLVPASLAPEPAQLVKQLREATLLAVLPGAAVVCVTGQQGEDGGRFG